MAYGGHTLVCGGTGMTMKERLEAVLASGTDNAQLRFGLATIYFDEDDAQRAREHALVAVRLDPDYSAAWRLLGRAETKLGLEAEARRSFESGLEVAERKGDRQLVKEMQVFLRRLRQKA